MQSLVQFIPTVHSSATNTSESNWSTQALPGIPVDQATPASTRKLPHSTEGQCKDLHDWFKDVYIGIYGLATCTKQRDYKSTNTYYQCFLCPFSAPGIGQHRTGSLATHFHTAHMFPAMLHYYNKRADPLETLLVFHMASIYTVPPTAGIDQVSSILERKQFHHKFRSYNRAKPVQRPDKALYRAIAAQANTLIRNTMQNRLRAARMAAEKARCRCGLRFLRMDGPDGLEAHLISGVVEDFVKTAEANGAGNAPYMVQHGWAPLQPSGVTWQEMQVVYHRISERAFGKLAEIVRVRS